MKDLPAVMGLSEAPSPARLQRMANVALNRLGHQAIDVDVEPRDDGRVAIILSEAWAYLFLAHLEAQAKQIHEKVRRAMYQARMKDARLQAEVARAAAEWEKQQERIRDRYRQLIGEGLGKTAAVAVIKRESAGDLSATIIRSTIEGGDPIKTRERKKAREERNARIRACKAQRMKLAEIAEREKVSVATVKVVIAEGRRGGST